MRWQSVVRCAGGIALLSIFVLASSEMAQAGPSRPLYFSTGSQIQVFTGGGIVDSWITGEQEYSIAVNTTVKTWSQGNPFLSLLGREYELDGTPTGATYLNGVGCCFRDGTTDGQFNYAVRQAVPNNVVYRFNLDWTDPQPMPFSSFFTSGVTGIAYDSSDDTFWLASSSEANFVSVLHLTRTGDFISFFGGGEGSNVSLAYDATDNSLWIYSARPALSELVHFAASDDMTTTNFPFSREPGIGFVSATEFQLAAVPEPSTCVLFLVGVALVGYSARRSDRPSRPRAARIAPSYSDFMLPARPCSEAPPSVVEFRFVG
jgi:WD40 repeat protein